jgi:hypothetical protein
MGKEMEEVRKMIEPERKKGKKSGEGWGWTASS